MPGHKGACEGLFSEITPIDFTEIAPTGNLYTGEGAFTEAEALCANYAGAKSALFFTCGSTQGIYTMLAEAVGMGGELILERGCHKSVYNAMALLDITPHYIYASPIPGTPLSGAVTPEPVENALCRYPASKAVFLTSPTYYGVVTDLAPISALCHAHSAFLLVDQAHGAHFPSVGLPSAPEQDADLSVVSTHKTWPALGSSSVLYVGSGQQGGGDTRGKANRTACGNIGTGKDDTACNAQCNGQLGRRQGDDVHNGRKVRFAVTRPQT